MVAQYQSMPKVELHVHLEGSIEPSTVLKLANRNGVSLPADTVAGLKEWYSFRDFPHFVEVYVQVSKCIRTPEDIEFIAKEFLEGQYHQNVLHSEITYTASTIEKYAGIPWEKQLKSLGKARQYGLEHLGISCGFIFDIVRGDSPERALEVANWAVRGKEFGVVALGMAGEERLGSGGYERAFDMAHENGLAVTVHAGETCGAESIAESIKVARPHRIGHGVRILEDPNLAKNVATTQMMLEVCPTSNICLGVFQRFENHSLPQLIQAGLNVSVNSDDPPMFGTTISDEYRKCSEAFGITDNQWIQMNRRSIQASFLPDIEKANLYARLDLYEKSLEPQFSNTAQNNPLKNTSSFR